MAGRRPLVGISAVARYLGISRETARQWVERIPHKRTEQGQVSVRKGTINAWLEVNEREARHLVRKGLRQRVRNALRWRKEQGEDDGGAEGDHVTIT